MGISEIVLVGLLILANLALGLGIGIQLAKMLRRDIDPQIRYRNALALVLGMYFIECLAFPAGMATQIFSIGLAFVWGLVLGVRLRAKPAIASLKFTPQLAVYTCLPTISFGLLVPMAWILAGNSPFTAEAGLEFGIPGFIPWPLRSVAGFAAALVLGTVVLKSVIMVGEVSTILHLAQRSNAEQNLGA